MVPKGQMLWDSTYIKLLRAGKFIEMENGMVGARGHWGDGMGTEFQFGMMKKFWRWMVAMVAQ